MKYYLGKKENKIMIDILLDKIIKSINIIALMSFIYTIVRNISMGKYEKKSYRNYFTFFR